MRLLAEFLAIAQSIGSGNLTRVTDRSEDSVDPWRCAARTVVPFWSTGSKNWEQRPTWYQGRTLLPEWCVRDRLLICPSTGQRNFLGAHSSWPHVILQKWNAWRIPQRIGWHRSFLFISNSYLRKVKVMLENTIENNRRVVAQWEETPDAARALTRGFWFGSGAG